MVKANMRIPAIVHFARKDPVPSIPGALYINTRMMPFVDVTLRRIGTVFTVRVNVPIRDEVLHERSKQVYTSIVEL